ncbi:hypothetical protein [Chromohalobacter sp. 296-RDG]|uniref:hypothetical protein n=1 Tax=Chromohalobacter sp. 296-RDG TaxID=2994062 RepID=UPI002469BA3B|nr:hypothetical protein [Chromohalobacter sp. 296-RDG]
MTNVTQFPGRAPEFDLPMEVFGVLMRQAEPTVSEIAHEVEMQHKKRFCAGTYRCAIKKLRALGYEIHEHDDPDGVRYELVQPEGAA